jgi:hypothetical protein
MSSNINPNLIDVTYPVAGQDNNTQGFRDNFAGIKANFEYAEQEINSLQDSVAVVSGPNDFDNNLVYDMRVQQVSLTRQQANVVANVATLGFSSGHYWTLANVSANTTLAFNSSWPTAQSQYGQLTLEIDVANTSYNYTLPAAVDVGNAGITGLSGQTLSFASIGKYQFTFGTYQNGSSVTITENNSALKPFNNSSEDLAPSTAASLAKTTSYFSTAGAETATLAAGVEGQIKVFAMKADSGDMVITVTNAGWKTSGTGTITFNDIGDACTLQYVSSKWFCIGNNGCSFA